MLYRGFYSFMFINFWSYLLMFCFRSICLIVYATSPRGRCDTLISAFLSVYYWSLIMLSFSIFITIFDNKWAWYWWPLARRATSPHTAEAAPTFRIWSARSNARSHATKCCRIDALASLSTPGVCACVCVRVCDYVIACMRECFCIYSMMGISRALISAQKKK